MFVNAKDVMKSFARGNTEAIETKTMRHSGCELYLDDRRCALRFMKIILYREEVFGRSKLKAWRGHEIVPLETPDFDRFNTLMAELRSQLGLLIDKRVNVLAVADDTYIKLTHLRDINNLKSAMQVYLPVMPESFSKEFTTAADVFRFYVDWFENGRFTYAVSLRSMSWAEIQELSREHHKNRDFKVRAQWLLCRHTEDAILFTLGHDAPAYCLKES